MSEPAFVANTILLRLPLFFIQLPIMVSDSPPLWPQAQREYISAVSTRLNPLSVNASNIPNDLGSSVVQPNTFVPRASGATSIPVLPSVLLFMM